MADDPDRHDIGWAVWLMEKLNFEESSAFKAAIVHSLPGKKSLCFSDKELAFHVQIAREPGLPATLGGRASTLKQKRDRWMSNPRDRAHLQAISEMWDTASLKQGQDGRIDTLAEFLLGVIAAEYHEQEFAEFIIGYREI